MTAIAGLAQPRSSRSIGLSAESHFNSNSARKRRKYVPGDLGGGARFLNPEKAVWPTPRAPRDQTGNMSSIAPPSTQARHRREQLQEKTTYTSAATAAAAVAQVDGYKPREERGWEDFHPELDLEAKVQVFSAEEVDGLPATDSNASIEPARSPSCGVESEELQSPLADPLVDGADLGEPEPNGIAAKTTPKRRPGRPSRRSESMLNGLGSPPAPRIVPMPAQNPRERLNLPKPSYQKFDTFKIYETDEEYVDRAMENVGFQKSEVYARPEKQIIRFMQDSSEDNIEASLHLASDGDVLGETPAAAVTRVEYDMDEQDGQWLNGYNIYRKEKEQVEHIKCSIFEITMTQIEKEWHALEKRIPKPNLKPPQTHRPRSSSAAAVNGEPPRYGEEQDTRCSICDDGDCENTNAIVFCDGCDVAVHQECYGVPFIPEGQWLCRKCQNVGRATPTCIFCPNTDGAFKLTNENKWAHLLCAIWIHEVEIGNSTFMEPIMEVARVPRSRWKLLCYICNQRMGACIQCSNRNCYLAFHVTCAKRAKLYLRIKPPPGGPADINPSLLKAFCDKHGPGEWQRDHDVDKATAEAKNFYRRTMRGRRWADSQQSALTMTSAQHFGSIDTIEEVPAQDNQDANGSLAAQKRRRLEAQKNVWRLPSGAPIAPQIVFDNVESSLQRYGIRKRKEFATEACKYWTLKREARRGAALLKRLQLQMETFSSTEIARRDFAAMGAAGGPKLQRRIEFAESCLKEMETLKELCAAIKIREGLKLLDAQLLSDAVNIVYFPITGLLWPVLEKAQKLDDGAFRAQLNVLEQRLACHHYTNVHDFQQDLNMILNTFDDTDDTTTLASKFDQVAKVAVNEETSQTVLQDMKKLAKRILKTIDQPLLEAYKKEFSLADRTFEDKLQHWEVAWNKLQSRLKSDPNNDHVGLNRNLEEGEHPVNEIREALSVPDSGQIAVSRLMPSKNDSELLNDHGQRQSQAVFEISTSAELAMTPRSSSQLPEKQEPYNISKLQLETLTPVDEATMQLHNEMLNENDALGPCTNGDPLTPPQSDKGHIPTPTDQGIAWYMRPFDPVGITIQEERWTGREVLRAMSEELSEMDDEEMKGLADGTSMVEDSDIRVSADVAVTTKSSSAKKRKRRFW